MNKNYKNIKKINKKDKSYDSNKLIGLNNLEVLFNNIKHTRWFKQIRTKIIFIKLFSFNKKEKLAIQKEIFINYFNQYYDFNYDLKYIDEEFNFMYNKKMNFISFLKFE